MEPREVKKVRQSGFINKINMCQTNVGLTNVESGQFQGNVIDPAGIPRQ